jgi:hypothetical protein
MGEYLYFVGATVLIIGILFGRNTTINSFHARDVSAPVSIDNHYNLNTSPPQALPPPEKSRPDYVAWSISIVGVLIAAAQLFHDITHAK